MIVIQSVQLSEAGAAKSESHLEILQNGEQIFLSASEQTDLSRSVILIDGSPVGSLYFTLGEGDHMLSYELQNAQGQILESAEKLIHVDPLPEQHAASEEPAEEAGSAQETSSEALPGESYVPKAPFNVQGTVRLESSTLRIELPGAPAGTVLHIESEAGIRDYVFTGDVCECLLEAESNSIELIRPDGSGGMFWQVEATLPSKTSPVQTPDTPKKSPTAASPISPVRPKGNTLQKPGTAASRPLDKTESRTPQIPKPEGSGKTPAALDPAPQKDPSNTNNLVDQEENRPAPGMDADPAPDSLQPSNQPDERISAGTLGQPEQKAAEKNDANEPHKAEEIRSTREDRSPVAMVQPSARQSSPIYANASSLLPVHNQTPFVPVAKHQSPALPVNAKLKNSEGEYGAGKKVFVRDAGALELEVSNGSLHAYTVQSTQTKKSYPDLKTALEREKDTSFEVRAEILNTQEEKQTNAWTVVPLSDPVAHRISVPGTSVEKYYTLCSDGRVVCNEKSRVSKTMLCREFEKTDGLKLKPGEPLRLYVDDALADYSLCVDGKTAPVTLCEDELGQPYVALQAGLQTQSVSLRQNGKEVYEGTLQSVPLWPLAAGVTLSGILAGAFYDLRRRTLL